MGNNGKDGSNVPEPREEINFILKIEPAGKFP